MARREWREFGAAEQWASAQGLTSQPEWKRLAKDKTKLPADIPANPQETYKGQFRGWGYWLGTGNRRNKDKGSDYLPYAEVVCGVHALGLMNQKEWWEFCQSGRRPANIPSDPAKVYKDKGWENWGKWLGTNYIAHRYRRYRPFPEARAFVWSLGLRIQQDWIDYCQSGDKPDDIPSDPQKIYGDEYRGIHDWMGTTQRHTSSKLTKNAIYAVLDDIRPNVHELGESEMMTVLQQGGILPALRAVMGNVSPMAIVKALQGGQIAEIKAAVNANPSEELEAAANDNTLQGSDYSSADGIHATNRDVTSISKPNHVRQRNGDEDIDDMAVIDKKSHVAEKSLKVIDVLAESAVGMSVATAEFLVNNRVAALWDLCIQGESDAVAEVLSRDGGRWFQEIRDRFRKQKQQADELIIPEGWSLVKQGQVCPPNLMQRRTASLLLEVRRLVNISEVGTGKSGAAILSSRVVGARLTLIVTNLATVEG